MMSSVISLKFPKHYFLNHNQKLIQNSYQACGAVSPSESGPFTTETNSLGGDKEIRHPNKQMQFTKEHWKERKQTTPITLPNHHAYALGLRWW